MSEFVIMTDSSADLPAGLVKELELEVLPLSFTMRGKTYLNWPDNRQMSSKAFYRALREGEMATTSAVNVGDFTQRMEPILQSGRDILVLSFSSALSATFSAASVAARELGEKYPQRKVLVVDTLCASLGQGLLVWYAAQRRRMGESLETVRDWVEANKLRLCHWFTVDDLHFLILGGIRIGSPGYLGSLLNRFLLLLCNDVWPRHLQIWAGLLPVSSLNCKYACCGYNSQQAKYEYDEEHFVPQHLVDLVLHVLSPR